jgi:hypothetical protein
VNGGEMMSECMSGAKKYRNAEHPMEQSVYYSLPVRESGNAPFFDGSHMSKMKIVLKRKELKR